MTRNLGRPYRDPVDAIWLETARLLGMTVVRSADVFAAWDGNQTLTISTSTHFDPDDCLAQMIFHELCHALVEGPAGRNKPDWGLENIDDRDTVSEHACHRLQAALADPWGLRWVLAPTTEHRHYYEALPANPLAPGSDPAIALALRAWPEAHTGPWSTALSKALQATAEIAMILRRFAPDTLWGAALPRHPSGLPPATAPQQTCGGCAWWQAPTCTRALTPTQPHTPACGYWQAPLHAADCTPCGACCRQGFDVVDVEPDSPLLLHHADWIQDVGWGPQLPRPQGYCVALNGHSAPFRCQAYPDRPSGCRDLEVGGQACLEARRRVGLTP